MVKQCWFLAEISEKVSDDYTKGYHEFNRKSCNMDTNDSTNMSVRMRQDGDAYNLCRNHYLYVDHISSLNEI